LQDPPHSPTPVVAGGDEEGAQQCPWDVENRMVVNVYDNYGYGADNRRVYRQREVSEDVWQERCIIGVWTGVWGRTRCNIREAG
jgi:hypothetical protein